MRRKPKFLIRHPDFSLLAIDTAGFACSAALWGDGRVLSRQREEMTRGQAERLLPMVGSVLADAGASFDSLSALAVTVGPGAFTGVRIGLAAARGLALALNIPLVGVTCFEAVAAGVPGHDRQGRALAVALESKRDDLYLQVFAKDAEPETPPRAVASDHLSAALPPKPLLLAGDAKERAFAALEERLDVRVFDGNDEVDAGRVAALVAARGVGESPPARPLYLRPPDASVPRGIRETG
jgi:tRNA threonylcarbamoyladenosine biosynthesis protein TsaB